MQKYLEFRMLGKFLESHHINLRGKALLDAGCGSGYGLKLIHDTFNPQELRGFDILAGEVALARKRGISATITRDSIVATRFPPETFDAVFEFTILHHVPQWRDAIKEVARILKPQGVFLLSDLNKFSTDFFAFTTRVHHPPDAQFQWPDFIRGLQEAGFAILQQRILLRQLGLFLCQKR